MSKQLGAALAAIAPPGVAVGTLALDDAWIAHLRPAERALVASAGPTRLREFATGRALLRSMLSTSAVIGRAPNGSPDTDRSVVVSLAHDRHHAIAAVASRDRFDAVGIDLEPVASEADPELAGAVLRDDEDAEPVAAFVMKEAAYKAWSSLGGPMLEPHDIHTSISEHHFVATVLRPVGEGLPPTQFDGFVVREHDYWMALVAAAAAR